MTKSRDVVKTIRKGKEKTAINYEDALEIVLKNTFVIGEEERPIVKSAGQVLAENIYSNFDLPQASISGPDGYAVRSEDIGDASAQNPAVLRIAATARAGRLIRTEVTPGTAIRIMTGSVVPEGADCVVRFEDTDEPGNKNGPNRNKPSYVKIYVKANPGDSIRPAGSNVKKGALIVQKGTVIGPTQISALASIGKAWIKVVRRPVVAIIATGDELIKPGRPLSRGKTYNSNTATISSLVSHYGGIPRILGIARDKEDAILSKIPTGVTADVVITSGGVSKGDYDLVRLVVGKLGKVIFSKIKMGPGAAVAFGVISNFSRDGGKKAIPVFSLAGPPAGCIINFETLVRPALLKMRGIAETGHPAVDATAMDSTPQRMGMAFVKYSRLEKVKGEYRVILGLGDRLGMIASMAAANSLAIIPAGSAVKAGDTIKVLPLDWRQEHPII